MSNDTTGVRIYDLICGNLEERFAPDSCLFPNEFVEGSFCAQSYNRMLEAYSRLCVRLGVEEWSDEDVEIIIDELMGIGKHLALKMYDYGARFDRAGD